jgi:hypothetical protein
MNLRKEDVHVEAAGKARYGWLHVRSGKSRNAAPQRPDDRPCVFSSGAAA